MSIETVSYASLFPRRKRDENSENVNSNDDVDSGDISLFIRKYVATNTPVKIVDVPVDWIGLYEEWVFVIDALHEKF